MAAYDLQNDKTGFGCITSILALFASFILFIKGYTLIGWIFLAPTLLLNFISFLRYSKGIKRNKMELLKQLESLKPKTSSFKATQDFTSSDLLSKIAIDEQAKRISIWGPEDPETSKALAGMPYKTFEYEFEDILAVEMSEDGVSLGTKTSRSTKARSLLDGFLSKVDGTFIGASRPPEKTKKHVTSLDLTIIVNDSARPLHTINFYRFTGEGSQAQVKKGTPAYQEKINKLRHWYMLFSLVMEEANKGSFEDLPLAEIETPPDMNTLSSMDELLEESKRRQHGNWNAE